MKPVEGPIAAASAGFQCDAEGKGFRMEKGRPCKEMQDLQLPLYIIKVVCLEWLEDYLG